MALTPEQIEQLKTLYYDPKLGLSSLDKLYRRAKPIIPNLSLSDVKSFLSTQETNQVFKRRKIKYHFPLSSYSPLQRVQIDLLEVGALESNKNNKIRYLFNCVDTYTKFAFSIPLKNKGESEVLQAWKKVVSQIKDKIGFPPLQVDSDQEASFRSRSFRKFCLDNQIIQKFSDLEDQTGTSQVERFNRTIRSLIEKYKSAYHTKSYIAVLPELLSNYNSSYHGGIKETPEEAILDNSAYDNEMIKKIGRARDGAVKGDYSTFKVGDRVRLKIRKTGFSKEGSQFTKTLHTITSITNNVINVSDRAGVYKKSELLKVGDVEQHEERNEEEKKDDIVEEKKDNVERRVSRRIRKEGIERKEDSTEEEKNDRALRRYRNPRQSGFMIHDF